MTELTRTDIIAEERAATRADALDRAWRTFKQGILIDAAAATGTGVLVLLGELDPTTPAFWTAAGAIAARSFVAAAASYLHRLKTAPAAPVAASQNAG